MYWGKVIGTIAGLATLKPWAALVGFIVGHQFDRGFADRFRAFQDQVVRPGPVSEDFVRTLFLVMGHVAKTDGRVTEEEIRAARSVMHRLSLPPARVRQAIDCFESGKAPDFQPESALRAARRRSLKRLDRRLLFVRLLLEVALSKRNLHQKERTKLWTICSELGVGRVEFAQLEAMIRAQRGFRASPAGSADAKRVGDAYEALGLTEAATNAEIKTAYRRLMNKNHPDKMAGDNPDALAVAHAERRTREIRKAYEMLKARRSIR